MNGHLTRPVFAVVERLFIRKKCLVTGFILESKYVLICIMMFDCNRYDKIRARKLPEKMKDRADLLFPITVYDTSNNTKVGEYHTKQEVLAAVNKYKQERKSRARILVTTIHHFTTLQTILLVQDSP
jgi:hypothetical protein